MYAGNHLRLLIIIDDRICRQTGIRPPESLIFGQTDPFPFDPEDRYGMKGFTFIAYDDGVYRIRFTSALNAVITTRRRDGSPTEEIRSEFKGDGIYTVSLKEVDCGKIVMPHMTIAFVSVAPPRALASSKPGLLASLTRRIFGSSARL